MCGFVGFCNLNKDISSPENINTLKTLTQSLSHPGPDEKDFFISKHTNLGHKRLVVISPKNGNQLMSFKYNDNTYTIVYNGRLYNSKDIREELINLGYEFNRIF